MKQTDHLNNLQKLRVSRGWTQEELAKMVNTTRSHISHWETGEQLPPLEQAGKLAAIFNVSIEYLFQVNCSEDSENIVSVDISHLTKPNQEVVLTLIYALEKNQSSNER